jgi:hypothetical protein
MVRGRGKSNLWMPKLGIVKLALALVLMSAPCGARAQSWFQPMGPSPGQFSTPAPAARALPPDGTLVPPADIPNVPPPAPPPQPPPQISPLTLPQAAPPPPAQQAAPSITAGQIAVMVGARFARDMPITGGLIWRVFRTKPDANGSYRPIKEDRSPTPTFMLPAGDYVVHATLGLASAAKVVQVRSETMREVFDIPAGGLRFEGKVGDVRIPAGQISFDVYQGSQFEIGDRRPIGPGIATGDVLLVPEGTYYIVSNYGDGNAVVRSDIRVQAGKLTDVTVNHRAAVVTLKLVGEQGGEALPNTVWSVVTTNGDVVLKDKIGAFPRVVLSEGDYQAIARNEGDTFEHTFKVVAGVDGEVEVSPRDRLRNKAGVAQ